MTTCPKRPLLSGPKSGCLIYTGLTVSFGESNESSILILPSGQRAFLINVIPIKKEICFNVNQSFQTKTHRSVNLPLTKRS